jgi:2-oxoisovalerate dehydrogenase E2 component (dihydrolipoyl transacylase)
VPPPAPDPSARATAGAPAPCAPPGEKPLAAPAVRKRAWELGIELQYVHGSGPAGRITHADLDAYCRLARPAAPAPARPLRRTAWRTAVPVIGLRRKIAEKMQLAKRRIPHFTYVEESTSPNSKRCAPS